jgi:hypothetical protein
MSILLDMWFWMPGAVLLIAILIADRVKAAKRRKFWEEKKSRMDFEYRQSLREDQRRARIQAMFDDPLGKQLVRNILQKKGLIK